MKVTPEVRRRLAVDAVAEARALAAAGQRIRADSVLRHAVHEGAWAVDVFDAIWEAAVASLTDEERVP